jgi:DMSO/TMAO reductase YedYZ molybdopterin-dependent catalytic subunit
MKTNSGTILITILMLATLAACAAPPPATTSIPSTTPTAEPTQVATRIAPTPGTSPTPCILSPIIVPTRPAQTPDYTQLDPTTGLHMTGTPQEIDLANYRLKVSGKVDRLLSLTYDDLRCMPRIQTSDVLTCPGFFEDEATWAGASLEYVLELAGLQVGTASISLVGADGYSAFLTLQQARSGNNYLAYEWEGKPIPILHGFPVRAVFPSLQGNKWVKWLVEIKVE